MNFVQQIHFFGPINVSTAEMFRNMLLNAMNTQGLKGIEILMSSEGGDLNSGFTMYNYLRSFPLPTTVINMGAIESIALIPFLGAGIRRAVPIADSLSITSLGRSTMHLLISTVWRNAPDLFPRMLNAIYPSITSAQQEHSSLSTQDCI